MWGLAFSGKTTLAEMIVATLGWAYCVNGRTLGTSWSRNAVGFMNTA
jgi:hypothetical protein